MRGGVPLLDQDGSTLGLVNAANPDSGPVTNYAYDPSGNPTWSGAANDWPFQYQGMEKEYTDPGTYYYSGGGQFYSPQLVRSLSETSATSTQGANGGPAGQAIGGPSGGGSNAGRNAVVAGAAGGVDFAALSVLGYIWAADGASGGFLTVPAIVASILDGLVQLFLDIFDGGSDSPPTPRKLLHGRHPLYAILGIQLGLLPSEDSAGTPPRLTVGPCPPVPGNPGTLKRNIDLARKHSNVFYLERRLVSGGIWDYRPGNEDFGNFNYGATLAAAGYPDQFTLRFAGFYHQRRHGESGLAALGCYPYGNKQHSEAEVAQGIDYVEMGCDHD